MPEADEAQALALLATAEVRASPCPHRRP